MPSYLIERYYGKQFNSHYGLRYNSIPNWSDLFNFNCNSFKNTFFKVHSSMKIDDRDRDHKTDDMNIRKVKESYNKFHLSVYENFDCQDENLLDAWEAYYTESDFLVNPSGYNREMRRKYVYNDFDWSKIESSSDTFCKLVNMMDSSDGKFYDIWTNFEDKWFELIIDLETCDRCGE